MVYTVIPRIKDRVLGTLFDKVCLTLKIHPWSLLIESEEGGKILVFIEDVQLTVYVITNVLKVAEIEKTGGMEAVYYVKRLLNSSNGTMAFSRDESPGLQAHSLNRTEATNHYMAAPGCGLCGRRG